MTKGRRNDSVNIASVRLLEETFYRAARLACILIVFYKVYMK